MAHGLGTAASRPPSAEKDPLPRGGGPGGDEARRAIVEVAIASAVVTGAVTLASAFAPERYVATIVGVIFLGATWHLVWRKDDATVVRSGLALAGLVLPGRSRPKAIARAALEAIGWAFLLAAIFFVPFWFGWRWWWGARHAFAFHPSAVDCVNDAFGQVIVIALPEEAFYRGYLQSRLDWAFRPRWRIGGAEIGPGLLVASAIFALGHLATVPAPVRLAVFFPSLVFGWLRARTRGIGAGVMFHAMCNLFSQALGQGYGLY